MVEKNAVTATKRELVQLSLCTIQERPSVRELLQLAVSALLSAALSPAARIHPRRRTELACLAVPAIALYHPRHILEERFRMRARVILPIPKHLGINEDAEDVLPVTPAVDVPRDVPDPVLQLLPVVPLDVVDDVGVELLAVLHLAEDDVPNVNLGGLLLDREFPPFAVTAWMGWNVQASHDWTRGHIESPVDL